MEQIEYHRLHESLGARFGLANGAELVSDYGNPALEYDALRNAAAFVDLSYRGRICLTGEDRTRFLNGQITNNIKTLRKGQGCYAALLTSKGKMVSDLHVHCLEDEVLIDLEPGQTRKVIDRFEKFIVADDVEIVDLNPHYGHLSIQGPKAMEVFEHLQLQLPVLRSDYESAVVNDPQHGELVVIAVPRLGTRGFDFFVPTDSVERIVQQLLEAVARVNGRPTGWTAMEWVRIESGIPRFGQDMDETNIPLEAGIEERAIRYNKGCYVGQEVINRIHSIGQVAKSLRGLLIAKHSKTLPAHGDLLLIDGKQVGHITSSIHSPLLNRIVALGYVRREVHGPSAIVTVKSAEGEIEAELVDLPFSIEPAQSKID